MILSAGAFAGSASLFPLESLLSATSGDTPLSRPTHRVLADLHVHALINEWNKSTPLGVAAPGLADMVTKNLNKTSLSWERCHQTGVDVLCAAHFNVFDEWLSMPTDLNPDAKAHTLRMLDLLEHDLKGQASAHAKLARNHLELKEQLAQPKDSDDFRVAVIHALEGAHALGGDLDFVKTLSARGVAMIGLTHFFTKGVASSANSYPFFPDANSRPAIQGLSGYGRELIQEMEKHGILVDVTHATSTAITEMLDAATRPMVATHASARTLGDHPYSLYDEQIVEITGRGGMIGVILYPFILSNYSTIHLAEKEGSLREVVATIRYLTKLCGGHRQIGIGSDFAGFITGPKYIDKLSQIDRLRILLLDEFSDGLGDSDAGQVVEDIMANNVIRFLQDNWRSGIAK
jgi:microsomal dipeptidase-like Zn-dependent dipeptidase